MWPERYHEMPMTKALAAQWNTPRVYYHGSELVDPHREHFYGSLGNGLDPHNISYLEEHIEEDESIKKVNQ